MPGSLGTGIPLTLKCSTCKKSRNNIGTAECGELFRTGKTRPYKPTGRMSNAVSRITKTAHQLWCSVCTGYMWSAHSQAERKPLIIEEVEKTPPEKEQQVDKAIPKQYSKCLRCGAGSEWLA